jgi:sugar phosphate isomerase/epimerase
MRPIGYSTGALALSDVERALSMLRGSGATAIELSALRISELRPLIALMRALDLSGYPYVSFHAPSRFEASEEAAVADAMAEVAALGWPVVLHPDTIHDTGAWRQLGGLLALENMDKRKRTGRTVDELSAFFDRLPDASFCFDIGHAHQVDRTMTEAHSLVKEHGPRLRQLHVSEVNAESRHETLSRSAVSAFQRVARWVPGDAALILETPAGSDEIRGQLALAAEALAAPPGRDR